MKGQKMIQTLARKRMQLGALAVLAALVTALFAVTISSQSATHKIVSTTDTDFVIAEGGSITVQVEAIATPGTAVTAYVFGEIFGFVLTGGSATDATATYRHQAGGPTGDFTITATNAGQSVTQKLTVGEAGTNFTELNVILGYVDEAGTARAAPTADGAKRETDTAAAGGNIFIEVQALNSRGEPSIIGAASDNAELDVTVFAVGASVASGDSPGTASSATGTSETFGDNTVNFVVSTAATEPGKVEVFAVASIGSTTVRTTESLFLNFSGGPDTISAGEVTGGLLAPETATAANMGYVSFEVTSVDKAGADNDASNTAAPLELNPDDISTKITNADGEDVTSKFDVDESAKLDSDAADAPDSQQTTQLDETKISDNAIAVVIAAGTAPGVPGGTYTATVTLDEGSKNSVEVMFNVVGPLDSLTAEADPVTVVEDGEFTVTATLLDANGLPVADGKADVAADPTASPPVVAVDNTGDDVTFTVIGGDLKVYGQDSTNNGQTVTKEVKAGNASATFYVTGDSGKSIVLVRAGNKTARVTVATEDADEAMADTGPSLSDFSRLSGLASYSGPDAQASELMELLAGRATAIWLSSGDGWVLYSSVDGAMVPGSMNFTATAGDVIYISN